MTLPAAMRFGAPQVVGGTSPMQTSPSGSMGIHGQYHTPPGGQHAGGTPHGVQTPNFGMTLGRAVLGPEVELSGRHNGLCRYLSRLLRPLWNEHIVVSQPPSRTQPEEQFYSRYSFDELAVFLEQVYNFKSFFERNPQLLTPPLERSHTESPSAHLLRHGNLNADSPHPGHMKQRSEAAAQEFDSTRFLYQLVVRCYECLSLWKLVCEYQLHLTVSGLGKDLRERLKLATFRFLILSGRDLTSALISSLLARYAGETGLSATLSSRLRDSTPSLFSQSDAIVNKANELVALATASQSSHEQHNYLRESLKLYSEVSLQLSLKEVCCRYQALHYLEGVIELCLCTAQRRDPQNLGLHFYKSGQPTDDTAGKKAFFEREYSYCNITAALSEIKDQAPSSPLPSRPGPPTPQAERNDNMAGKQFNAAVAMALHSTDELFHVHLYSWFRSVGLTDRLVEIKTPYIENYLKYTTAIQQDNRVFLDLLWRYYEKNGNYGAAAKILDQLANREGPELTLDERIEYVSRAVMCAKSSTLPTASSQDGEFLHQLEEKMEVALVQLSVLELLSQRRLLPEVTSALHQLNSELMDITQLYEHFAEKFDLPECKLAIVHCAGHYDPTLLESLWRDIIENELRSSATSSVDTQFVNLRSKLVSLGSTYAKSERFFPVEYLALTLEQQACERHWRANSVHRLLREMGVATLPLYKIYDNMFKAKDPVWVSLKDPLHVLSAIHSLLFEYVQIPSDVSIYEQPAFNNELLDCISHYLVYLQTLPPSTLDLAALVAQFRNLQSNIQKLALTAP